MPVIKRVRANRRHVFRGSELERLLKYIQNNHQFRLWGIDVRNFSGPLLDNGCTLEDLMNAVYGDYARVHGKLLWCDKTPGFLRLLPTLADVFPESRFVHITRDGRDVYLSEKRFAQMGKNAAVAALEWAYKVEKVRKDASRCLPGERYREIQYETLTRKPEETLRSLCSFLGLEFEPEMLDYWKSSDRYIGSHHSDLIFRPVSLKSVGKWKEALPRDEAGIFEFVAGSTLASLGYDRITCGRTAPGTAALAAAGLARGLPLRLASIVYTAINLKVCSHLGIATTASGKGAPPSGVGRSS